MLMEDVAHIHRCRRFPQMDSLTLRHGIPRLLYLIWAFHMIPAAVPSIATRMNLDRRRDGILLDEAITQRVSLHPPRRAAASGIAV